MTPFIVAEIGSNWRTKEDCIYAIRCAKLSGADAVKFQLFDWESLYGRKWPGSDTNLFRQFDLPREWIPELAAYAVDVGIEFMCSAFSPELAEVVDPFVKCHKIASAEMNHVRLLQKVASFKKPVILSTAAATWPDIEQSIGILKESGATDLTLMYCVGSYPAKEIDFRVMDQLKAKSKLAVGYSDHSTDVLLIPVASLNLFGATVLEKHFNALDPGITTPDSGHSLNMREFKLMVSAIRHLPPPPTIGPTPDERDMTLKHRRRLKVIKPIKAGDTLKENENFGIFRSLTDDAKALSPFAVDFVNGKRASVDLNVGDGIGPKDFVGQ